MMRGSVHHLDLTVRDPWTSCAFYDAVLGFMGYERVREDARGFDWELTSPNGEYISIGLKTAQGAGRDRAHDRYAPGLHHVAWRASSRLEVDLLYDRLLEIRATVLDPPADYPSYEEGYYAVFFADPDGLKLEFVYTPRTDESRSTVSAP
jgi:catechol 2,3-dioxygenase-like lactoylglutathione lyase family enzyme